MENNPQKENGYTPIANEIMEALARAYIPRDSMKIILVILRKSYGWNKKDAVISMSEFAKYTGIETKNIPRSIKKLLDLKIILKTEDTRGNIYRFNKHYGQWLPSSKLRTLKTEDGEQKSLKTEDGSILTNEPSILKTEDDIILKTEEHKRKKENIKDSSKEREFEHEVDEEKEDLKLRVFKLFPNIGKEELHNLIYHNNSEYLARKIAEFIFTKNQNSGTNYEIGFLIKSINENYDPPIGFEYSPNTELKTPTGLNTFGINKKLPFKKNGRKEKFTQINDFTIRAAFKNSETVKEGINCFMPELRTEITNYLISEKNLTEEDFNKTPTEVLF